MEGSQKTELVEVASDVKRVYCLLGLIKDFLHGKWKLSFVILLISQRTSLFPDFRDPDRCKRGKNGRNRGKLG